MSWKPLVYLAGPYTSPSPTHNVAEAVRCARLLEPLGIAVFVPHLSVLWDMLDPRPYDEWLEYDYEIIRRCDALFRMDGASPGADVEMEFAKSVGVPVFVRVTALGLWANEQLRAVKVTT